MIVPYLEEIHISEIYRLLAYTVLIKFFLKINYNACAIVNKGYNKKQEQPNKKRKYTFYKKVALLIITVVSELTNLKTIKLRSNSSISNSLLSI